jgi:hypothetical protein
MYDFRDNKGRLWSIRMTLGAVKRVREKLGADLLRPDAGDPPLVTMLHLDRILLFDVIFALIQPQADEAQPKVSEADFQDAIDGTVSHLAYSAFMGAWADFFRDAARTDLEKVIRTHLDYVQAQIAAMEKQIPLMFKVAEKKADRAREKMLADLQEAAGEESEAGPGMMSGNKPA